MNLEQPRYRYVSGKNAQFNVENDYTYFKPSHPYITDTQEKNSGMKEKYTNFEYSNNMNIQSSASNKKYAYSSTNIYNTNETRSLLGWLAEEGKLMKEVCLDGKEVRDGRWHYIMANRSVCLDGKYVRDGRWHYIMANRLVVG